MRWAKKGLMDDLLLNESCGLVLVAGSHEVSQSSHGRTEFQIVEAIDKMKRVNRFILVVYHLLNETILDLTSFLPLGCLRWRWRKKALPASEVIIDWSWSKNLVHGHAHSNGYSFRARYSNRRQNPGKVRMNPWLRDTFRVRSLCWKIVTMMMMMYVCCIPLCFPFRHR